MAKKAKQITAVLFAALMVSVVAGVQVYAGGEDFYYLNFNSPQGMIYPDIEAYINKQIQDLYGQNPYGYGKFANYSVLISGRNFYEQDLNGDRILIRNYKFLPDNFKIPDSWDDKITNEQIKQIKDAFLSGLQNLNMDKDEVGHYVDYYDGNVGEDYTRGLAVINKLQAGERWIDAFYKIEKGLRHQEFKFENLDTFDEYFLSNLNYSFSEIGKKDENIEYSASDSYEYIGKSLVENAKSTEFLFHLLRVQDYILDVDDRDEKHINIIGKSITEDPNNPPVAIEAYNESGKKITPIDVKEYKDKGESTREYTFKIPVKAGKNEVRFVSDIKEINLTVNVGSISEPAKEPDGKKTNPKQPAPGETTISGYTIKGGILTGIAPFTPSTAFIEGFDGKYDVTVINQSNKEVASKYIYMGTGMTVKLTDGKTEYELKVAIKGDVTGTGGIDAGDARGILRHVAKLDELEGAYLAAADLKNDGNVDASNARMVLRYAAGLEKTL